MDLLKAILLGIIQGVTEFLPVSSSGHLAIAKKLFGMNDVGTSFDVFLHIGTLVAVFVVYWRDIAKLFVEGFGIVADTCANFVEWVKSKSGNSEAKYRKVIHSSYRKFAMLVIVSTIPTGIIGMMGEKLIDDAATSLLVPGICLIVTAVLLFISDQIEDGDKTPKKTTYANAAFMGVCQGIATLPGLSRSGTTITAGLLCGLKREFAVKYSFIMSIPAILGAAIIKIPDMKEDIASTSALGYVAGAIVSAVVGYICIKTMLVIVRNKKFKYFSYYCVVVGLVAIIGSFVVK
ncbi:MAG: undecaprenyl-diphosphate phosphatase [Eubacterium sp.]|nr:undecaprenyl-diphosphate phosphatase [Eubacterium sp.]